MKRNQLALHKSKSLTLAAMLDNYILYKNRISANWTFIERQLIQGLSYVEKKHKPLRFVDTNNADVSTFTAVVLRLSLAC